MMKRKSFLVILALAVLAIGPWMAAQAEEKADAKKPVLDQKVADFTLTDIYGKSWALSETMATMKPKAVVLEVLSMKCPVSLDYDERSRNDFAALAEKDVLYLGICSNHAGHENARDLRIWAAKKMMAFPILLDQDQKVADQLGAGHTPTYYVLDAQGVLRYYGALDNQKKPGEEGRVDYVMAAVESVMAGKPVEKKNVQAFGCGIKRAN